MMLDILPKPIWHNVVEGFGMNATNVQMGDWLGLRVPATEKEVLRIVEGKLAPTVIKRLISLGLQLIALATPVFFQVGVTVPMEEKHPLEHAFIFS